MVTRLVSVVVRALLVGGGYVLALLVVGTLLRAFGVRLGSASEGAALLLWLYVSGVLIALLLGPLASSLAAARGQQLIVWSFAIFFNRISTLIEGAFFAPELIGRMGSPSQRSNWYSTGSRRRSSYGCSCPRVLMAVRMHPYGAPGCSGPGASSSAP